MVAGLLLLLLIESVIHKVASDQLDNSNDIALAKLRSKY